MVAIVAPLHPFHLLAPQPCTNNAVSVLAPTIAFFYSPLYNPTTSLRLRSKQRRSTDFSLGPFRSGRLLLATRVSWLCCDPYCAITSRVVCTYTAFGNPIHPSQWRTTATAHPNTIPTSRRTLMPTTHATAGVRGSRRRMRIDTTKHNGVRKRSQRRRSSQITFRG